MMSGLILGDDGLVRTTRANLIANRIFVKKGIPFGFADRPWMIDYFNDNHDDKLLVCGRQVNKSTAIAGEEIINGEINSPFSILYLSPTFQQTKTFSHQRLGPTIAQSPSIQMRVDGDCLSNVLEKEFIDGSMIYLSYAKDNADRCRGLSVDQIDMDEIQDMSLDTVYDIVKESLFMSGHKYVRKSGTPKSKSNNLETQWRLSDQREWMVRCRRHGKLPYHQAMSPENLGLVGPICKKKGCGQPINTLDGRWVRTQTVCEDGSAPYIHGYRIPQLLLPTNKIIVRPDIPESAGKGSGRYGPLDYARFLREIASAESESVVLNEKFGLSADSSDKPISEDQIRAICRNEKRMPTEYLAEFNGPYMFAGVDWGYGKGSATALVIGQFDARNPNKFKIVFCRKYDKMEADPTFCVPDILRLCKVFRVKRMHADWGGGFGMNSDILNQLGDDFLTTNYWSTSIASNNVTYDKQLNRFVLNKSITMSRFFKAMRSGGFEVNFSWDEYRVYANDILAVYREQRKNGDPFFDHDRKTPDDFCHATIYAWLVASWMRMSEDFVRNAQTGHGDLHNPSMTW